MLNLDKSFLRNLFDRFSSKETARKAPKAGRAVKGLKARSLSMEPLEERQLLSVTSAELQDIANTYTDFDLSSVGNVIEITSNHLTAKDLANAINTAQGTTANDLIVVRTVDEFFTIDLADTTQAIEAASSKGSITIVGYGETPLTITSSNPTAVSITAGTVNLGNIKILAKEEVADSTLQPKTTESPVLFVGQSAKVTKTDVATAKDQFYTAKTTDDREAIISYRTDTGIWSVDFEMKNELVGSTFRSFITGFSSAVQALEAAENFSTYSNNSYLENSELTTTVTEPVDAEISGNSVTDSYLSWAASTANMLYYTGWGNKTGLTEDEIYDYILSNFSNGKYTIEGGVEWYMNGDTYAYAPSWSITDKDGNVVSSSSDANRWAHTVSDGGNVFGSQYDFDNYGGSFNSNTYYSQNQVTGMTSMAELLKAGYATAVNMQTTTTTTTRTYTGTNSVRDLEGANLTLGSTAVSYDYELGQIIRYDEKGDPTIYDTGSYTVWGYVYNTMLEKTSTNYYTGLYVTNPLDTAGTPTATQPNRLVLKTMNWIGYETVTMSYVQSTNTTLSTTKVDGNTYQTGTSQYIDTEKGNLGTWSTTADATTGMYSLSNYVEVSVNNEYRINSFVYLAPAMDRAPVKADPYEPNNDAGTVDSQKVGEENSSNLGIINGTKEISGLTLVDYIVDPRDWFKFTTENTSSSGDYVAVQYSTSLFSGDLEIFLYNRDDNGVLTRLTDYNYVKTTLSEVDVRGTGTNTYQLKISLSGLAAGDYYVQVVRASDLIDCKGYSLTLKAASDDAYEINNTLDDINSETAKANLGALTENVILSDLVMKQVSTASTEGSEVDGFRFEMTGVGGPNTYIELQFTDATFNINDSRLEMRIFKQGTDEYYAINKTSWGELVSEGVVVSEKDAATTIIRASMDGCDSGTYYIKITGFINAQNLLNYKLNIHLSDEDDPAGIGTTSKPDFVVTNPEDQEWEKPVVISKELYEDHDTENVGKIYSNDPYFYSKDTLYMNLSYRVADDSSDLVSYDVTVSLVVNGKELVYDKEITLKGEYATDDDLRNAIFAKLTNELEATVVNGEAVNDSNNEIWNWKTELKDGMIVSVVDSLENVLAGYFYQNGKFIAISSASSIKDGDLVIAGAGQDYEILVYKTTNVTVNGKNITALYVTDNVMYPADFNSNTGSTNLIEMKLYTGSGTSVVYYNIDRKGFYTASGQAVSVSAGTLVSYTPVGSEQTSYYTYNVVYNTTSGTIVTFTETLIDLSGYKVSKESDRVNLSNNSPLTLADGTQVYYTNGKFYNNAVIASGTMLKDTQSGSEYRFAGFAATDINSGIWNGTLQFEGKFLKLADYTNALYCQDGSYSIPLYFNSANGFFYKENTFVTKVNIATGTLFAKNTTPDSADDYFIYYTTGTTNAVPYGALWANAEINSGATFSLVGDTDDTPVVYTYLFTEKEFAAFRTAYEGVVADGDRATCNTGAVNQLTLIYHDGMTGKAAGFYQITDYDAVVKVAPRQNIEGSDTIVAADGTILHFYNNYGCYADAKTVIAEDTLFTNQSGSILLYDTALNDMLTLSGNVNGLNYTDPAGVAHTLRYNSSTNKFYETVGAKEVVYTFTEASAQLTKTDGSVYYYRSYTKGANNYSALFVSADLGTGVFMVNAKDNLSYRISGQTGNIVFQQKLFLQDESIVTITSAAGVNIEHIYRNAPFTAEGFYRVSSEMSETTTGLKQVYSEEYFFPENTKLLFYRDANDGGFAASYLKITPSNTDISVLDLYKNDIQFIIYSSNGLSEYNVSNNSASTSFNVFRTQDDFFVPNATITEMIESTNPETFDPNKTYDSTSSVNPNLGPVSGSLNVNDLVMLTGNDWFSFELQGPGDETNSVRIDFMHQLGDLDLYVYVKDDTYPNGYRLVGRSCTLNDFEEVSLDGAEPGTYYIRVAGFSKNTNPNYSLTINGSEPQSLDGVELAITQEAKVVNSAALISWNKADAEEDYVYGGPEEYFISTEIEWISDENYQLAKAAAGGAAATEKAIWEKAEELGYVELETAGRYATQFTITDYEDGALAPETTYHYRVRGINNNSTNGKTEWTAEKTFTTEDYYNDTKYYAIVIGSSKYSDGNSYDYIYNDAYNVYNTLVDNAPQYTSSHIYYINGEVTLQKITQAFANVGATAGSNDVVFVYYTGVGSTLPDGNKTASYLNTYDNTISVNAFYDLFANNLNVGEVQVVLNPYYFDSATNYASFSYTGFGDILINGFETRSALSSKVTVITNAANGENVQLDSINNETFFGRYMIEAMTLKDEEGNYIADTNKDGRLSMDEVYQYTEPKVATASGNKMNGKYLTSDPTWESILIKGDWTETPEYLAKVGQWFEKDAIVVTTGNDVVDSTDGLTSLREAIDKYLGITVYGDDNILYDKTTIKLSDGTEMKFAYGTTAINPNDTFKIGDTDYRYSVGLVANVGSTGFKTDDKILESGTSFVYNGETYTYTLADGKIVIKDSEDNDVTNTVFKTPTAKIKVDLEDGTSVTIRQSGIMEETKVLNKIIVNDSINTVLVEKPIEIDNAALENVAENTAVFIDGSNHLGELVITGNGQTRIFEITYDSTDADQPAIENGISINIAGLTLSGGVADKEANFGSVGGAIYNAGENVYLANVVLADNGARSGDFLYDEVTDSYLDFSEDMNIGDVIIANGITYTAVTASNKIIFKAVDGSILSLNDGDLIRYTKFGTATPVEYIYTNALKTDQGGAVYNADTGILTIVNATISANTANNAAVYNDGTMNVYNSIIAFNNAAKTGTGIVDDIYSAVVINPLYSFLGFRNANVTLDPASIDGTAYTADEIFKGYQERNFNIVDGVPVINTADISLAKYSDGSNIEKDIAGYSRSLYGKVDMGAYEWKSLDKTMDTIVNTLEEDELIGNGKNSLREAVSYAGQDFPVFNKLANYDGQTMIVNGVEVSVIGGQLYKDGNVYTPSNGDAVILDDGTEGKICIDSGNTYIETSAAADTLITIDLDGIIANDFGGDQQAFINSLGSDSVLTFILTEGAIGIYDTVIIDGLNRVSDNINVRNAVKSVLLTTASGTSVFTIDTGSDKTATVRNVTLTNGAAAAANGKSAITQLKGNLVANTVIFENNKAVDGAAIYAKGGTVTVTGNSEFNNNTASGVGGAIYAENTDLTVADTAFSGNSANSVALGNGGAVYLADGAKATLTNSNFSGNTAAISGGAVYVAVNAELGMSSGSMINNSANTGGALYNAGSAALQKVTTVTGNTSAGEGGAVYNTGNFYAEYSSINANTAGTNGGGIYNGGEGRVLLLADQINGNVGGGIYDRSTNTGLYTVTVADSIIAGNFGSGGLDSTGKLQVISSTIVGNLNANHADFGQGIYISVAENLTIYNSIVSHNGGVNHSGLIKNVEFGSGTNFRNTGSLVGGDPSFTAFDVSTDWKDWKLTSSDSVNVCGQGDSSPAFRQYMDLAGNQKTLLYDITGKNSRVKEATGGTVIDRGAYQASVENYSAVTVNTLDEYKNGVIDFTDDYCTLLEAIYNISKGSASADTITFDAYDILLANQGAIQGGQQGDVANLTYNSVQTLYLDGINGNYTIDGRVEGADETGKDRITVNGNTNVNNNKTLFGVNEASTNVTVKYMVMTNGYAVAESGHKTSIGSGGAISIFNGYINLEQVEIRNNIAEIQGGGIYVNNGKLRLTNVLIDNNIAEGNDIASNEYGGGGIYAENYSSVTISDSTIAKNEARNFSGIYLVSSSLAMYNSLVIGNTGTIETGLDFYSKDVNYSLIHNNIIGIMSPTQNLNGRNGNMAGTVDDPINPNDVFNDYAADDFRIDALQNGKTSLAVNTGSNLYARDINGHLVEIDITGTNRFGELGEGIIDIGAYENSTIKDEYTTVVTTLHDIVDSSDGLISLREAVSNAKKLKTTVTFDTEAIQLNDADFDGNYIINLTGSTIDIGDDNLDYTITIDASDIKKGIAIENGVTLNGAALGTSIFSVTKDALELKAIVLTGARVTSSNGAAISVTGGTVSVTNGLIYGNTSEGGYGALYVGGNGSLSLLNTTVAKNTGDYAAVYINSTGANIVIKNSILAENVLTMESGPSDLNIVSAYTKTISTSLIGEANSESKNADLAATSFIGTAGNAINPGFIDSENGDFRLNYDSIAINTGANASVGRPGYLANLPEELQKALGNKTVKYDLAGNDRIYNGTVDMGAYEFNIDFETPDIVVTTLKDVVNPTDGLISLREAISYAGTVFYDTQTGRTTTLGRTITFDLNAINENDQNPAEYKITLDAALGAVSITKEVTINASNVAGGIIIDAASAMSQEDNNHRRAFEIATKTNETVQLAALVITGGDAGTGFGGAILQTSGNLYIVNSVIYDNTAARGGAIAVSGSDTNLTVVNTTITKNNATYAYGGIYSIDSNITVSNTLVAWSTNMSRADFHSGGYTFNGLYNDAIKGFSVDNYILLGTYNASFFSIADENFSINGTNNSQSGTSSMPLNPYFTDWDKNDFTLTKTPENKNSSAINGGTNPLAIFADGTSLTVDIAGDPRFRGVVEIGAYETALSASEIPSVIVTTTADVVDGNDGLISLREAIAYAGNYGLGKTITFAETLLDYKGLAYTGENAYKLAHTVILDSQLFINKDVKIDGSSFGTCYTVTMADKTDSRLIYVDSGNVEIIGLTLTQRYTERSSEEGENFTVTQGGAIYLRTGSLIVRNTLIYDNYAQAGAAIYVADGSTVSLTLRNVTVTDNFGQTGAVFSDGNAWIHIYNTLAARNTMSDLDYNDIVIKYTDLAKQNERFDLAGNFFQREEAGTGLNKIGGYNQQNGNLIGYYDVDLAKYTLDNEAKEYLFDDWDNDVFTLKDNSLAVNGGVNVYVVNLSEKDCIGNPRMYASKVDIGAFENQNAKDSPYNADGSEIVVTIAEDVVAVSDGYTSLREAITLGERLYDIGVRDKTITFSRSYLGDNPIMKLKNQSLSIARPLKINASSIGSFTIDCEDKDRGFIVNTKDTDNFAVIQNIVVKNGNSYKGAGIFLESGALQLLNVLVHSSKAVSSGTSYGGGVYANENTYLTLVNCTVANNTANEGAGVYGTANSYVTVLNSIIAQNRADGTNASSDGDIILSGTVSEQANTQNRVAYSLIGNSKSLFDILGTKTDDNGKTNVIGYGPDNLVNPYFNSVTNSNYTLNPKYNSVTRVNDNKAAGSADRSIAVQYGITVDLTKAGYNNPADMGAYQIATERPSTIVTTVDDIVNPYDNLISLREAVIYYCKDNIYSDMSTDSAHNGPIGFSEYYSNGFMLPDLSPITFSEELFEGTTGGITIKLNNIDYYGAMNVDWFNYSNIGGASPIPIMDILIDASSVAALGGVTIDANGTCENIFTLTGFCRDKDYAGKYSVQLELIGLTLTGATGYAIDVDPYSIIETHDCLIYRNGGGIMVWDENNALKMNVADGENKARDKWYGIANICNTTIVNNYGDGIYNWGETKLYNSIVVLNNVDLDMKATKSDGQMPTPGYRVYKLYNTIYDTIGSFNTGAYTVVDSFAINTENARLDLFVNVTDHDYRLAYGSIAINTGNNLYTYINKISHADPEVDRNGANRIIGGRVDIGAYEYLDENFKDVRTFSGRAIVVDTTVDAIDYSDGKTSLREAVLFASQFSSICEYYDYDSSDYSTNALRISYDAVRNMSVCYGEVTFAAEMNGQTILLDANLEPITISTQMMISASNLADGVTIDGANGTNAFYVNVTETKKSQIDVVLQGLNYTNGFAEKGGAIYIVSGNVLVKNSKFYKNEASLYGGAIYAENGELTIYGSQIGGNKAAYYGGVVNVHGTLLIQNSIIAENYGTVGAADPYDVSAANKDFYYYTAINERGTRNNIFGKTAITKLDGTNADGRKNYIAEMDGTGLNNVNDEGITLKVDNIFKGNWVNGVWTYDETADGVGGLDQNWALPTGAASASEAVEDYSYAAAVAAAVDNDDFDWLFDEE